MNEIVGINRKAVTEQCSKLEGITGTVIGDQWVKFGTVTAEEVSNQVEAHKLLNGRQVGHRICRVPQVLDYYSINRVDYLIMEYTAGVETCDDDELLEAVVDAVQLLHSKTRLTPGPCNGGPCSGLLFDDQLAPPFASRAELQDFVNSRLDNDHLDLSSTEMVFNHGDLALRNLQITPGCLWILDWAFGGYLPRSAEVAALRMQNLSTSATRAFTERLEAAWLERSPLSDEEVRQVDCFQQFSFRNISIHWPMKTQPQIKKKSKKMVRRSREKSTNQILAMLDVGGSSTKHS